MTSIASRSILPQGNPDCAEYPLPPWLLHDLLQPLNAYGLASEQIRDALQPLLASNTSLNMSWEAMGNAIQNQERMLRALRQFLYLASPGASQEMRSFDLGLIAQLFRDRHNASSSKINLCIQGVDGCFVMTHPDRLMELVSALVENASSHAKTMVSIVAHLTPEIVRLEVADDGKGLEPGIIELLGRPFLRHSSRHIGQPRSLGLGIFIACRIAQLLGLVLEVSSTQGEGCRFSLTLPRAIAPFTNSTSTDKIDPISGSHLLIIDSDEQHGHALQKLFTSWDCRSDHATDWTPEIANLVHQGKYDALLVGLSTWLMHKDDIRRIMDIGSASRSQVFVLIEQRQSASDAFPPEADEQRPLVLHRPLTPSRLRSALTNALCPQDSVT